jgi:hypothetical protein
MVPAMPAIEIPGIKNNSRIKKIIAIISKTRTIVISIF